MENIRDFSSPEHYKELVEQIRKGERPVSKDERFYIPDLYGLNDGKPIIAVCLGYSED